MQASGGGLTERLVINNANAGESDKILELFRDVDDKLEGSGEEQEDALRTLREHEDEVSKPASYVTTYHWYQSSLIEVIENIDSSNNCSKLILSHLMIPWIYHETRSWRCEV